MNFTKMHGAGNDYIYVNGFKADPPNPSKLAVAISDRHTGAGADGLIIIRRSERADFRMEMYNADGSEGEMCGNGIRCIGKYVFDRGMTRKKAITVETKGGIVGLELHARQGKVHEVTVAMGQPRNIPRSFHRLADDRERVIRAAVEAGDRTFAGTVISMGNPHFVVEVEDAAAFPVATYGPLIERHPDFPSRVNVEFVQVLGPDHVKQRTWERGSGETLACGSGACAAAVALKHAGRTGDAVAIDLPGGTLRIRLGGGDLVTMTGPAVEIFSGDWPDAGAKTPGAKTRGRGRTRRRGIRHRRGRAGR